MSPKCGKYTPLQNDEEEAKSTENEIFRNHQRISPRAWVIFHRIYSIALHVLTISTMVLLYYSYREQDRLKSGLLPSELRKYMNNLKLNSILILNSIRTECS